jgi:hypothetical protein
LLGWFNLANFADEVLKLLYSGLSYLNKLFSVLVNAIVRIELFLELNYGFVALIQARRQCDHDIPLLEQ